MTVVVLFLCLVLTGDSMAASNTKIDDRLASSLASRGSANVLVSFKEGTSTALASLRNNSYSDRSERLVALTSTLQSLAEVSQKSAVNILTELRFASYKVFWITNQIYLRAADRKVVDALAAVDNVLKITEDSEVSLNPLINLETSGPSSSYVWGVENIGAPEAWNLPGGNQGEGVVVGSIDTGVWGGHPELEDKYVGEYGWMDCTSTAFTVPTDDYGHGTYITGIMVAGNGIGVAPKAKWIACKAYDQYGIGTWADLICCGQFMLCPDGKSNNCSKAPGVINNSWGEDPKDNQYTKVVEAWHAAIIIPVFANGNEGPNCRTVGYPAKLPNVIAVGASNLTNGMASFSSKGPSDENKYLIKPEISAPGVNIKSTWRLVGINMYRTASGTSASAPHVAGVTALLLSRNVNLKFDQIKRLLTFYTNKKVTPTGYNCEGSESQFPNNAVGFGIVNATASLQAAIEGLKLSYK